MKWVGLVEAPDETTAAMWCELLRNNDVPAAPKLAGAANYAGVWLGPLAPLGCWVMVQEDDVDKAASILEPIVEHVRGSSRTRRRRRTTDR